MLTWQGMGSPSLESVRLMVSDGRLRFCGRLVAAADHAAGVEAFNVSYDAFIEPADKVGRLLLHSTVADEERQASLSRTEDGVWLIDHGSGARRNAFDGAIDVDVAGAVTFICLPIRRLGLHRRAAEHDLPVLSVSLPDLSVSLVRQTYRTVSIGRDGAAVVNHSYPGFSADLTVDADGMVVSYPGVARLI
jgi:uncharacterized protein